jgi:PAS domain S-box-containing protein
MRKICFIVILLFNTAIANVTNYEIKSLSVNDGLSQSTIYSIYQDSIGFMWFGTQDGGLNKWDGYSFTVFEHLQFCDNCISGNDVSSIVEFSENMFFIGTWGEGLNVFDSRRNVFSRLNEDSEEFNCLKTLYIQVLLIDRNKNLWIGTDNNGLYKVSFPYTKIDQYIKKEGNSIIDNRVWSLCEDEKGNIWIGTGDGLSYFDIKSNSFENFKYNPKDRNSVNDTIIRSLFVDSKTNLWVGSGTGLSRFDKNERTFKHYYIYKNNDELNAINTIIEDKKGNLWIGTFKSGLVYFNTGSKEFELVQHNANEKNSISHNDVRNLLIDRSNNLWIGTRGGGINIIDLKPDKFPQIEKSNSTGNSLSNNRITGIVELNEEEIWLATSGGGINLYNQYTGKFSQIFASQNANSISSNTINTIYLDSEKTLWIGYWDRGVEVFDPISKTKISSIEYNTKLAGLDVQKIVEDSHKNIWIGTTDGLNRINKTTGDVYTYLSNSKNPISANYVFCIYEDSDHDIWIGTSKGLNKYNRLNNNFIQYKFHNSPDSLINDRIQDIYEDSKRNLWIGTQLGLHEFKKEENRFISYRRDDKIINNTVFSILEDDDENLWLGLLNGLSKFNTNTNEYRDYRFDRDSRFNDFSERIALKLSNGKLMFGGVNGFNIFDPKAIKENTIKPNVVITQIKILHQPINNYFKEKVNVNFLEELKLNYNQSTFSISFTALDYSNSNYNQYRYMLEGYDNEWINGGYDNTVSYTKVTPGNYVFKVAGSNNDGLYCDTPASINVIITPPFWLTKWFLAFVILFAVLLIHVFIKIRQKLLLKSKKELEEMVAIRTSEIEQQKEEISAQADELNKLSIVARETESAVTIMDDEGSFEWVNEGFTKKYGLTLDDLISQKGENIISVSNHKNIKKYIDQVKKKRCAISYENEETDSDGNEIWVHTSLTPIFNGGNKISKIISIDTDISKLKKVEEQLRQTNDDITSSILYAKRIQESIMPSYNEFKESVPESFMLYMPKDIVSGDFFWFTKREEKIFLAISDCTGHGVPGAFMSILGVSFLNEIVKHEEILTPNLILDSLNKRIIKALHTSKSNYISTDGMDIALMMIDFENKIIEYAGANHPLYLIREDNIEIFDGDRMPIGFYQESFNYSLKVINVKENDQVYSLTDGIIDQFGGSKGKKFKSKKFKELLLKNRNLSMKEQKEEIGRTFFEWRGEIEQIDDVLVVGIKI